MKKILLVAINAKYIHTNPALYSLKAYAHEYTDYIKIVEYTINQREEEIIASIYQEHPSVIAISCYIWNFQYVSSIVKELNKIMPHVSIWLGGPEVSFKANIFLEEYYMVTGIMVGEGEETFKELVEYYLGLKENLLDINGIIYQEEQEGILKIVETLPRELTDINTIPFLYDSLEPFKNRIIYYESSRGCPFRCSYCLSAIDKRMRLRDLELVKRELDFFLKHNVAQVKFIDRTFNSNRQHALEIWAYIHKYDNGVTNFHFEIATELLGEEEFELLAKMRTGLVQLEIGVQSTNRQTLDEIQRVMSIRTLEEAVKRIRKVKNIHLHLDLIAGLPYEGKESFINSFNQVYQMKPNELQLGFLKVLKGTPMEEKLQKYKLQYLSKPPYEVLSTKWLSYEEILELKRIEELVKIYYNSNQFCVTIELLEKEFRTPFAMYKALADYYDDCGYFTVQPSRTHRYHTLFEFIKSRNINLDNLYTEALTYDLYARENLKSRPSFAVDLTEEKTRILNFYKFEEQQRTLLPQYKEYNRKQMNKMLHVEVFRNLFDIKTYILFDYQERNPLTNEVKTINITSVIKEM